MDTTDVLSMLIFHACNIISCFYSKFINRQRSAITQRKVTKVLLGMGVKWHSLLVLLLGVILSFADPITDILTLVEFYRADHKTWFGVGLAFVILPCLFFSMLYSGNRCDEEFTASKSTRVCAQTFLCACHPFSAALRRLEGSIFYLKQLMCGDGIDSSSEAEDDVQSTISVYVFFESVFEAAPQFVIQLYAMSVQEEPVTVIQIISLPVSFLSLAWAFTTIDAAVEKGEGNGNAQRVKYKCALFVTQVLILSSRLFAICYFTVSYKWWVVGVLFLHIFVIGIADTVWYCQRGKCDFVMSFGLIGVCCLNLLRDDVSGMVQKAETGHEDSNKEVRKMQLFSNVLFVLENLVMILLYYFSEHSNNWYSLPVTVCVCVLSVLGAITRVKLVHFLYNDLDDETVNS